jgi:hypothetical protein
MTHTGQKFSAAMAESKLHNGTKEEFEMYQHYGGKYVTFLEWDKEKEDKNEDWYVELGRS